MILSCETTLPCCTSFESDGGLSGALETKKKYFIQNVCKREDHENCTHLWT